MPRKSGRVELRYVFRSDAGHRSEQLSSAIITALEGSDYSNEKADAVPVNLRESFLI